MESSEKDADSPTPRWAVHRQDDNGNRFVLATGLTRDEAEQLVVLYQSRGHKQLYWAEVCSCEPKA